MRRHPALVALSHDHHHALVEARRLRRAASGDEAARRAAVDDFVRFFATESEVHFREEEELVFPLLAGRPGAALVERAVIDHAALRGLVRRLQAAPDAELMREAGERLEAHVRLEERELFPAVEAEAGAAELEALPLVPAPRAEDGPPVVHDCAGLEEGIVWGLASEDLNATLIALAPGGAQPESINAQRDVLVVAVAGAGTVEVDGEAAALRAPAAVVIGKGRRRRLAAGPDGLRFLSVHLRRPGLELRQQLRPARRA